MGCICSKETGENDYDAENEKAVEKESNKSSAVVIAHLKGEQATVGEGSVHKQSEGSLHSKSKTITSLELNNANSINFEDNGKNRIIERPKNGHRRPLSMDLGGIQSQTMSRIVTVPNGAKGEQVAAGWPTWLASVAGEAIHGWTPRSPDSYEKLDKIGQGTYSSVYKARDLKTDKIVAMKKVRFVNMDTESVRFMAREICILRRLDHPNVMKLEAVVTSRISGNLYLVFEYMEHDLSGLLASPKVKFTEPQVKCYARQMLLGLEHCHSRGVLHRDIKGSNLLVDNNGVLKIGDFGLATRFEPDQKQPLTSHVVTLWYRAPELLLGATKYGEAIDMWSAGCIVAELFAGKPIMPGRTEVEQMHKIFKLCGSPSEEYWKKTRFPHATSFKSHKVYKRRIAEAFKEFPSSALNLVEVLLSIDPESRGTASSGLKSQFFTSKPLPCDPSSLPKYPPSKEFDAKLREEEARRRKAESVKGGCTAEHTRKPNPTQQGQQNKGTTTVNDHGAGFSIEAPIGHFKTGYSHSVVHPNAAVFSSNKKSINDDDGHSVQAGRTLNSSRQVSQLHHLEIDSSNYRAKGNDRNDSTTGYVAKKNRIYCSGPLMPPGGNMDDMLKEHERHIQEVMRRAREKSRNKNNECE